MVSLKERMAQRNGQVVEAKAEAPAVINPPEGMTALQRLKAKQAPAQAPVAAATQVSVTIPATTQVVSQAKAPAKAKAAPVAQVAPKGFTLYVNCAPNTPYVEFSAIAKIVGDTLKIERGCHYRLVEGLYGGNAALFAEALGLYLDLNPQGDIVTGDSQEAKDGYEAVAQRAEKIVRGF